MNKLIFLDNETGGIGTRYSLLTSFFAVTDENYNVTSTLALSLKPDDGDYVVCGEAMRVNKIDLGTLESSALTYKEAGTVLFKFLHEASQAGKIKLVPCGQGIRGDLDQIYKVVTRRTWEMFCSYRVFDTSVFAQGLRLAGLFPENVSGGLSSLADYFKIKYDTLHTAEADTLLTMKVMEKLLEIVKP
jgi:hypothetical protein